LLTEVQEEHVASNVRTFTEILEEHVSSYSGNRDTKCINRLRKEKFPMLWTCKRKEKKRKEHKDTEKEKKATLSL
jgi:hypothetical protein